MTKEEMISIIYEKVADKTLSFGCKVNISQLTGIIAGFEIHKGGYRICNSYGNIPVGLFGGEEISEIIGHPILIGRMDILIEKGPNYFEDWTEILDLWEKKDEPIEKQNDKCIEYIYNLISK